MLVHDCTLITTLFTVLLLTAASDSSSSIRAINNNEMLTLLGLVGYADQLFALDSSCTHPRDTVKLNTCFVTVCVPATAGTFLWAPAVRARWAVWHTGVPGPGSHSGCASGHHVVLVAMPGVLRRQGSGTVCRGGCCGAGARACPTARPACVHRPGCEPLLTMLISVVGLRRTKLTAEGLAVVF